MNINFDPQAASTPAEQPVRKPSSPKPNPRPVQARAAEEQTQGAQASAPAQILQATVSFRRDSAGQVYYVVSDAQSGKEIREFPPEEVRKAGAGIEEFLKQQAQEADSRHVEVKA